MRRIIVMMLFLLFILVGNCFAGKKYLIVFDPSIEKNLSTGIFEYLKKQILWYYNTIEQIDFSGTSQVKHYHDRNDLSAISEFMKNKKIPIMTLVYSEEEEFVIITYANPEKLHLSTQIIDEIYEPLLVEQITSNIIYTLLELGILDQRGGRRW